jgi:hypothetical protein
MTGKIGSAILVFAYVIVLFVLVRPGSQGPTLVTNLLSGVTKVIGAGTGGGTWASG